MLCLEYNMFYSVISKIKVNLLLRKFKGKNIIYSTSIRILLIFLILSISYDHFLNFFLYILKIRL